MCVCAEGSVCVGLAHRSVLCLILTNLLSWFSSVCNFQQSVSVCTQPIYTHVSVGTWDIEYMFVFVCEYFLVPVLFLSFFNALPLDISHTLFCHARLFLISNDSVTYI